MVLIPDLQVCSHDHTKHSTVIHGMVVNYTMLLLSYRDSAVPGIFYSDPYDSCYSQRAQSESPRANGNGSWDGICPNRI